MICLAKFLLKAVLPAVAAIGLCVSAVPPSDLVLIRIDKTEALNIPLELEPDLQFVQELRSSWMALIPEGGRAELDVLGIKTEVLDGKIGGKTYFLVHTPLPGDAEILKKFGAATPLDDGTCLFWTEGGNARELLPPALKIKRLSLDLRISRERSKLVEDARPADHRALRGTAAFDPRISAWVAQVSKDRLSAHILSLQNFQTRYASTVACESAGTYLYNQLSQLGLASAYEQFEFSSHSYATRNIVATLPGKSSPNKVVIVSAHYDSYTDQGRTLAPGADDNASGTAAVLEIARILKNASFDYTVKFICFSAEEWGLYGSANYARKAKERNENIVGVINLDMIAYADSDPAELEVYVNSASNWLGSRYLEAAGTYAPMALSKVIDASATWSDHSSFWDEGFSALCGIEESADRNPYYHLTSDTTDKLKMDFAVSATKATLATVADVARPYLQRPAAPTGLQARNQIVASLFSSIKIAFLQWNAGPSAVVGYNIYRSETSGTGYEKINSEVLTEAVFTDKMLKTETSYYYVVTAIDIQGRESDYSDEVRDDQINDAANE